MKPLDLIGRAEKIKITHSVHKQTQELIGSIAKHSGHSQRIILEAAIWAGYSHILGGDKAGAVIDELASKGIYLDQPPVPDGRWGDYLFGSYQEDE